MYVSGLATAVPPRSYTQSECWEALERADRPELDARTRAILHGILTHDNGIARRSLALDSLDEGFDLDPDTLHRRFVTHAPRLAAQAGARALDDAGLQPAAIDAVVVSTCTGYLCPGLTSYVAEGLGLRTDVLALDLVGQGCGAALPNLRTAESLIGSGGATAVLSICVEVCSAAMYLDPDLGVLVSACLFGDGAGAAVLTRAPGGRRRVRWIAGESATEPAHRDALRFEMRGGRLRNILTLPVPRLAGEYARAVFDAAAAREGFDRAGIAAWVMHAGGKRVLQEVRAALELGEPDLRHSAAVLREHGNLSSPFVLFVLDRALREEAHGGLWWMSSFGAGFSCHGALLEVA
jgi:predicted naringenin-chalcone synthase